MHRSTIPQALKGRNINAFLERETNDAGVCR
jgi:hypothetical protein